MDRLICRILCLLSLIFVVTCLPAIDRQHEASPVESIESRVKRQQGSIMDAILKAAQTIFQDTPGDGQAASGTGGGMNSGSGASSGRRPSVDSGTQTGSDYSDYPTEDNRGSSRGSNRGGSGSRGSSFDYDSGNGGSRRGSSAAERNPDPPVEQPTTPKKTGLSGFLSGLFGNGEPTTTTTTTPASIVDRIKNKAIGALFGSGASSDTSGGGGGGGLNQILTGIVTKLIMDKIAQG